MDTINSRMDRRGFVRLLGGSALAIAGGALVLPQGAEAGIGWCRADPEFSVDGLIGNVYVATEQGAKIESTGPIQLRFRVPIECNVELLSVDSGLGRGYDISIEHVDRLKNGNRRIHIEVRMLVPAIGTHAVRAEFVPGNVVELADYKVGQTNEWIKLKTHLKKPK